MTNNNADQANHKDSNKEKEKKHDSGEIILLSKGDILYPDSSHITIE